jgi:hypothetical protein
MEQPGGVAAKRRVLVDALAMCLERSKVSEHVNAETLRTVLSSAMGDMWREGELRLDTVWKILTQQPGLSAKEVAPPLFVFKAYEEELGVAVRLPQALTAVPRSEQARLRDEVKITKDDFAKAVGELNALAQAEEQSKQSQGAERVEKQRAPEKPAPAQIATPTGGRKSAKKPLSKAAAATFMGLALAVCAGSLFLTLRSNAEVADFSDVASLLKIDRGAHSGGSWTGVIIDARWDKLNRDERQKLATQVFEQEIPKGVRTMVLRDPSGEVRVNATDFGGLKTVVAH